MVVWPWAVDAPWLRWHQSRYSRSSRSISVALASVAALLLQEHREAADDNAHEVTFDEGGQDDDCDQGQDQDDGPLEEYLAVELASPAGAEPV